MTDSWTGYALPSAPDSYEELIEGFEWRIPTTYNVAAHVLAGNRDRIALRHVPERAEEGGGRSALDRVRTLTVGDLATASDAFASRLSAAGVGVGDHVAVCLPQCPELVVSHLAVLRLGGVVVPVSMLLGADAFAHVLDHSDAAALVVDAHRRPPSEAVDSAAPTATFVATVDAERDALGGLHRFVDPEATSTTATSAATPPGSGIVETKPEDPAFVLYTSGTTSDPKGVVQSHRYLLGSLPGYHCWFDLFTESAARRACVWTPSEWAWAGALFDVVYPTLALGGTVGSSVRRSGFDPDRALSFVASQSITHAFLPPTALRSIRSETDPSPADVPALETIMCGGEQLPPPLAEWAETRLGVTVNEAYGQTEANALIGESKPRYFGTAAGLGRPYPGHSIAIVDDDGNSVPSGDVGEIAVELPDPVVMREYLRDPEATDAVLDGDLLRTGDSGRRSADGTITHLGRSDELVLTSGYRVSPLEVESVLENHSAVAAALVAGEPDPDRGQRIVATVVPAARADPDDDLAAALQSAVADDLGPHKRPRAVRFVDELPTTRTDKTDRSGHDAS